jgi:outer membrane protein assembly factor BamE
MLWACLKKYVCLNEIALRRTGQWSLLAVTLALGACGSLRPYSAEVVQGNVVTHEQVQTLRPGMPRAYVKDILGTPLVTSLFHESRWDYVFTIHRKGAEPQQRRLSVFFKDNQLVRIEGDAMPSESEFAAGIDARKPTNAPLPLKATDSELAQYPRATASSRVDALQVVPSVHKNYPPLETSSQ